MKHVKKVSYNRLIRSIFLHLAGAVFLLFLLMNFVASFVKVEGSSMVPLLNDQERVVVLRMALAGNDINRFDIIVFTDLEGGPGKRIKRILGLPGETIEFRSGKVFINDRQLGLTGLSGSVSMEPVRIPARQYFVMGGELLTSRDSRDFGLVPRRAIIGKAVLRYWPITRFGRIS